MTARRAALAAALGLGLAIAVGLALDRGAGKAFGGGGVASAPPIPEAVALAPSPESLPPLPASLAGTSEDGALIVDADGRFVPTADALDLFDYYLAAVGEEPESRIRARILAAIRSRLDGVAAVEAAQLLDAYLEYRARAARMLAGELVGDDLERRLQYLRELRREVFGAEVANALFGEEEDRWLADLERRRVLSDPDLSPEERDRRLAALDADAAAVAVAVQAHQRLRGDEARLRESGGSEAEVDILRADRFGRAAADRLADLDTARADWDRRLAAYRAERDRAVATAAGEDRERVAQEVLARHFEGAEQVRVLALDRIAAGASSP